MAKFQVYHMTDKYLLFNFKECTFRMNTTPERESLGKACTRCYGNSTSKKKVQSSTD